MVANIDRIYRFRYCPACDEHFSVDRRSCPTCGGRLVGTAVEEHRVFRWSGGHPSADVIRAALGSEMDRPDPERQRRVEAVYREIERRTQETMPGPRSYVFISYVRDDAAAVDRLVADLRKAGIDPWVDTVMLTGGERWKGAIRRAIQDGAGVVLCFSSKYSARSKTHMNEELTITIDEIRKRSTDASWCIPVRLDECVIPNRAISDVETLNDLQRIDMFPDWDEGVRRIVAALRKP